MATYFLSHYSELAVSVRSIDIKVVFLFQVSYVLFLCLFTFVITNILSQSPDAWEWILMVWVIGLVWEEYLQVWLFLKLKRISFLSRDIF